MEIYLTLTADEDRIGVLETDTFDKSFDYALERFQKDIFDEDELAAFQTIDFTKDYIDFRTKSGEMRIYLNRTTEFFYLYVDGYEGVQITNHVIKME